MYKSVSTNKPHTYTYSKRFYAKMPESNKSEDLLAVAYGRKLATVECIAGKNVEWSWQASVNTLPCATGPELKRGKGKPETEKVSWRSWIDNKPQMFDLGQ